MHSTQDSAKLPFWRNRPAFGAATLRLGALGVLAVVCATGATPPLAAQVALELESGAARIWETARHSERVEIGAERIVRAAVAAEGGHVVAGEDLASGDLFFLARTREGSIELPAPAPTAPQRSGPVLLARHDRLEGSVWLEGPNAMESNVVASIWNGSSFERVETVSKNQDGPQLALSATVLEDGSWLVLWAGFDGTDDDIFWSRRERGSWSKPRRLHADNRVPDILPTVVADASGARAAWSFYDGSDYRVRTARWNGRGWTQEEALEGRGVAAASFESVAGRSFLTFRTVVPEAWNLVEFESEGIRDISKFREPYSEAPLIVLDENERATLSWPWRRETARP